MTIALYTRVSTRDKGQDTALQLDELTAYCRRMGWNDIVSYEEQESAVKSRPIFDRLVRDCQASKIDVVLVWKLDRLARSIRDGVMLLMEFERLKVRVIATTQGIDTDSNSPVGRLTTSILMAVAEFERDLIKERVASGIAAAKRRGVKFGRKRIVPSNGDIATGLLHMAAESKISINKCHHELDALGAKMSRQTVMRRVREIRQGMITAAPEGNNNA